MAPSSPLATPPAPTRSVPTPTTRRLCPRKRTPRSWACNPFAANRPRPWCRARTRRGAAARTPQGRGKPRCSPLDCQRPICADVIIRALLRVWYCRLFYSTLSLITISHRRLSMHTVYFVCAHLRMMCLHAPWESNADKPSVLPTINSLKKDLHVCAFPKMTSWSRVCASRGLSFPGPETSDRASAIQLSSGYCCYHSVLRVDLPRGTGSFFEWCFDFFNARWVTESL